MGRAIVVAIFVASVRGVHEAFGGALLVSGVIHRLKV